MSESKIEKLNKSLSMASDASLKEKKEEKLEVGAAQNGKKSRTNGEKRTKKTYIAIDLKSFYASVECVSRSLNPLDAFLVVADETRTDKTICLAVSPALKSFGVPGRARLFEVKQKIAEINAMRKKALGKRDFSGSTIFLSEFNKDETLMLDLVVAPPRMAEYMSVSTRVYEIYKKFIAAEDIGVKSCILGMFDKDEIIKTLGLDKNAKIALVVALGYSEENYPIRNKNRKPAEKTIKVY